MCMCSSVKMNDNDLNNSKKSLPSKWKFWKHRRYVVAIMAFFGFFNAFTLRGNLSIAVVAMTSDRYDTSGNGTALNIGPEFDWSNEIQGYVLSSFFYGYIFTQLPGGYFANKYGGKIIFGTGIAVTAALTVVTPWLASTHVYLLMAVRIIEGVFEGVTYPSLHAIWSQWAPPLERSGLSMLASAGTYFGTVVAMPLSAFLAETFGWRSIFFVLGAVGLVWYALWMYIVADSPADDPKISAAELHYIHSSMEQDPNEKTEKVPIPWKSIVSSRAVWAICVANFCDNWGFYTLLTQLPKYLKDVYSYNLSTSGFLSSLPYLAVGIMVPLVGQIADFLISKRYLTVTQCRKSYNFLGFISQFCFLMIVAFVSSEVVTILCLTSAVGIGGFALSSYCVNSLDIAPQYASILMGLGNTFGTLPGIISPILSGYIVSDNPTADQWRIIFFVASGIYLFGAIFFATFASAELQEWAKIKKPETYNLETSRKFPFEKENSLLNFRI